MRKKTITIIISIEVFILCLNCTFAFAQSNLGYDEKTTQFLIDSLDAKYLCRYRQAARSERNRSNYGKAIQMYHEAFAYEDEILIADKQCASLMFRDYAYMLFGFTELDSSMHYYHKAIRAATDLGDSISAYRVKTQLAMVYLEKNDFKQALLHLTDVSSYFKKVDNWASLGYVYITMSRVYAYMNDYDNQKLSLDSAYFYAIQEDDQDDMANYYRHMAWYYKNRQNYDSATYFDRLAVIRNMEEKDFYQAAEDASLLVAHTYEAGWYDSTIYLGEKYLPMADSMKTIGSLLDIIDYLSNAYKENNQYKEAFELERYYRPFRDSLLQTGYGNTMVVEKLRIDSETKISILKKEEEIKAEVIAYQQLLIWSGVAGLVLLLVFIVLIYRSASRNKRLLEANQQQAEHLRLLDAAKTRFFANISHDLRSPLTLIVGGIEQVLTNKESALTAKDEQYLKSAVSNSERMINMTNEINELVKLDEGKLQLERKYVDLVSHLKVFVGMFESAAEQSGINLEFRVGDIDKAIVSIDPNQFEKVMYNLISNALKYSKNGDNLMIGIDCDIEDVTVQVSDSGEGIPEELLPYIFDRYYQVPDRTYKQREGFGIGLTFVKEIIERHGATIKAESELGKGSKFIVKLKREIVPDDQVEYLVDDIHKTKLKIQNGTEQIAIDLSYIGEEEQDKAKVLIVDDHDEVRDFIGEIINSEHQAIKATNGRSALELLERERVDLIITDLMMPEMDGFVLLEQLRSSESLRRIPVLVLSARTTDEARERVLGQGINDFLAKPFRPNELLLRVDNLLSMREVWNADKNGVILKDDHSTLSDLEKILLKKVEQLILNKVDDINLSVSYLADQVAVSERKFYRLIKKMTDRTPLDLIKEVRLQYAHSILVKKNIRNASEVAKSIGMTNVTYFNRDFKKRFGKEPQEMM